MKRLRNMGKKIKVTLLIGCAAFSLLSITYADIIREFVRPPYEDIIIDPVFPYDGWDHIVPLPPKDTIIVPPTSIGDLPPLMIQPDEKPTVPKDVKPIYQFPSILKGGERLTDVMPTKILSYDAREIVVTEVRFEPRVMVPMPVTTDYITIDVGDAKYRCRVYDAKEYDPQSRAKQFVVFLGKINPKGIADGSGLTEFLARSGAEDAEYRYLSFDGQLDKSTGNYVIPLEGCSKQDLNQYAYLAYPLIVVDEDYDRQRDGEITIPDALMPRIYMKVPQKTEDTGDGDSEAKLVITPDFYEKRAEKLRLLSAAYPEEYAVIKAKIPAEVLHVNLLEIIDYHVIDDINLFTDSYLAEGYAGAEKHFVAPRSRADRVLK